MPKIQVYEPPKYPKPPGFEESTGVFEANEDGQKALMIPIWERCLQTLKPYKPKP